MAKNTKAAILSQIRESMTDGTFVYNGETRGLLDNLYALTQQHDRSVAFEQEWKKVKGNPEPDANRIALKEVKFTPDDFEKKTVTTAPPAAEIKPEPVKQPEPEAAKEPASAPAEMQILDLYMAGKEKAIADHNGPRAFAKVLKGLGLDATGKTFDDHWNVLTEAFNKMNQ